MTTIFEHLKQRLIDYFNWCFPEEGVIEDE